MDIKPTTESNENVEVLINDEVETNSSIEDINNEVLINDKNKDLFRLPSGRALTLNETYEITASEDTKIIMLVGPSACGKTTIETTLYQLFHNDKVGDYYFAGSKTIQGYEQRAYYTRTRSKQVKPMTPRTSRGVQETFLHLKVWNYKTNNYHNLLFADLSGEDFESHIADVGAMQRDFGFIKSANYIIAIFDGELMSNKKKRNSTFEGMAQLLRTIYDAKIATERTNLQVVISKYDIVEGNILEDPTIEAFITRKKDELRQRLKTYTNEINFYNVAAIPDENTKFKVGYGVEGLLNSWCEKKDSNILSFKNSNREKDMKPEFDKLYRKILGDNYE
jgi:energy-coupling factor transporter ATP-binding protein EcfA2